MDKIQKFLAYNGKINITCVETTNLVEEARKLHDLSPVATATLGRVLTMGALMASGFKSQEDSVTLQIRANGPIGGVTVTAEADGRVRGYVANPQVEVPLREDGKLNVGEAVGNDGFLYVIKDIGLREPYIGMSKLVSGEIAEDFANYYYTSEQKNTAVALGVLVNKDGVKKAGGFIVSSLPDATEDELFILENRLKEAMPISKMLEENMSLLEIAKDITGDINIQILKQEEREPRYECSCNKEKMARGLQTIGKEELEKIIEEDKKAETVCQFCNKKYEFSEEELKSLIS
ncbi:MAG: Hsp33 family molecular chaperone HslO [Clostridia bacterium]|nr:Hsp33 family molecular chaperone HslO [Clostridia bacterium]